MAMNEGLKALLINKLKTMGVDPADAARLAGQPWFQDYATQVYKGTLPKGVPEITEANIKNFYSEAKKTGADPVQLFATEVSPSAVGARAGAKAAFEAIKNDPQPTSPTPLPTTGGAPSQGALAAPAAAPAAAAPTAAPTLASATGFEMAPQTGGYRQPYALTDQDRSMATVSKIASEADLSDPKSVHAVIDNMFNRLGAKGYGNTSSIYNVALEPKQYTGKLYTPSRPPPEGVQQQILSTMEAVASGNEPDLTNGATYYRAHSYLQDRGPKGGYNKDFYRAAQEQGYNNIGKNVYTTKESPGGSVGPVGPYGANGEASTASFANATPTTDTGPTVAAPDGGAPMQAAYNNASVASPEQDMGQMATLGAFPMPGEPGVDQGTPPPEMVSGPQAPAWQPIPDPEQTRYVTGPGSYMTSVPQPPAAPAAPVDAFNQPPSVFRSMTAPTVGGAPQPPTLGDMPQLPGTGLDDVMGTGASATDVAGYQGPNALPQNQFGPAPTGGMDQFPMMPADTADPSRNVYSSNMSSIDQPPMSPYGTPPPLTAGPPGTVPSQSPVEPNTYRPANTMFPQTMSPINQPHQSPFNPATAPPLGGAPQPQAPPTPEANAPQNPFAVPTRLPTPPGIFVSHQAGFDPNQDMTSTGYTSASAYAPSSPSPVSQGFSPTQGPTLGMSPVMGALAASAGMGGAAQSGFAHGPTPPPMQPGAGFNPATFAALKGFNPQGGQFSGTAHDMPGMQLPIRKPILPPLISPPTPASADPGKSGSSGVQQAQQAQQAAMAAKSAQAKIAAQQSATQSIGAMAAMNALSALANSGGAMDYLYKPSSLMNYGFNIGFGGSGGSVGGGGGSFGGM